MELHFTKMHGCGNDYIYFDCFEQEISDPAALSIRLSPRNFSVGGDGIVLVCPSDVADAKMRIFNTDGSEAMMCGNGIRCVAKFLYDSGRAQKEVLTIDTLSGIKTLHLTVQDGKATSVQVDMGKAEFAPEKVPVLLPGDAVIGRPAVFDGKEYAITCVSMGNPHCVVFCEADVDTLPLAQIGPAFDFSPLFPARVNTEFINVLDDHTLKMRVWERGSGETLACGTGACASVAAAVANGYVPAGEEILVHLAGGDLTICYTEQRVTMTGPAVTAFRGSVEV